MHKIIGETYLGNIYEAIQNGPEFPCIINCMGYNEMGKYERDDYSCNKTSTIIHIPTLRSSMKPDGHGNMIYDEVWVDPLAMNTIAAILDRNYTEKVKTLVHCAAAEERSPLAIIWWLYTFYPVMTFNEYSLLDCLNFVKVQHPQTLNRLSWLSKLVPYQSAFGEVEV